MPDLRNCEPCSNEPNQYEDDWACALIEWLEVITCIRWIRASRTGDRPKGQYGTLEIESYENKPKKTSNTNGEYGESDVCVTFSSEIEADIQLDSIQ